MRSNYFLALAATAAAVQAAPYQFVKRYENSTVPTTQLSTTPFSSTYGETSLAGVSTSDDETITSTVIEYLTLTLADTTVTSATNTHTTTYTSAAAAASASEEEEEENETITSTILQYVTLTFQQPLPPPTEEEDDDETTTSTITSVVTITDASGATEVLTEVFSSAVSSDEPEETAAQAKAADYCTPSTVTVTVTADSKASSTADVSEYTTVSTSTHTTQVPVTAEFTLDDTTTTLTTFC
ncbi:putative GPI-anchored protein 54 [Candida viswanathii]|uniref:Putative GPI-anchored protein 54 n=1 Tax=Candida viswanathii TaxID=5486 RepID=A0A367Y9W0_9ASCO|nr:putative GPI-anchored protein 54 [Candida viswanathii]